MLLHGSLHGYVLSDIFSLLVRQKASGNLELFTQGKEGMLFFREGMIAGALNNEELLSEKLFFLLTDTCHYPLSETGHLFTAFDGDITGLCDEIVRRNLLSHQALRTFAISVIKDIVCRFFLWQSGTYHFSTEMTTSVARVCPAWLNLPPEELSMEAVRRSDEWQRFKLRIDPDAVYAPTEINSDVQASNLHLHISTAELVLSRINGVSSVSSIIRTSCLTKYKTYEAIILLLAEKRIRPIENRSFRLRVRPRRGRERRNRKETISGRTLWTLFLVASIIAATIFVGCFVVHGIVLADLEYRDAQARLEFPEEEALQKIEFASFLFDASKGAAPARATALTDLRNAGLLTSADLFPLYELRTISAPTLRNRPAP